MAATYDDWKERGREHIAQGRPLDALTCFRQAARLHPRAPAPLIGIADALWRLGQPREAIATWRELVARRPEHASAWLAIAEAAAFIGDDAQAADAASHVGTAMPGDPRAAFVAGCARLADARTRDEACASLVELLREHPSMLRAAHFAGMLARALAAGGGACTPLRELLAGHAAEAPLALVAEVADVVTLEVARAAAERDLADGDPDPMRVLAWRIAARALAGGGDAWASVARRAAARYADAAARRPPEVPLAWPRRAAGHRGRIVVLVDTDHLAADAKAWTSLVGALAALATRIDLGFAAFGDAAMLQSRLKDAALDDARITQMPAAPDIESARSLAASEPDILVDAVGLRRPLAALLAARPARHLLAVAGPFAMATPLVDAVVDATPAELARALGAAIDTSLAAPSGALTPGARQAALAAAIAAHRDGRHGEARAGYDALLADAPGLAPVLHLRGALRREVGDADALDDFAAALAAAPRDVKSRVALTQLLLARHRLADARRVASEGLDGDPAAPPALWRAFGHVALAQQDGTAAVNAFAAALAQAPLDAETHFNHGVALQMLRQLGHAARAYQRALELEPALLDAHFNLGVVFDEMGEVEPAIAALETVIERAPARAEAHRALLNVLARHSRGAQWMRAFERFEKACPDALGLVANALEYYQYRGDYARVHRYVDRLAQGDFKPVNDVDLVDSLEQLLYLMLFFDIAPGTQASLYATYDKAAVHVYGPPISRDAQRRPGRIRIGYLSADFRDHVMGRMMLDVVRHHDRARFDVRLYSTSPTEDDVTAAFRGAADAFVELAPLGDDAAVKRIAEDDLDLLVDLSTHTRGARPAIMARKPARVAITHIASAGALGLSAVDFKLTDARADLPDNDRHYVETLLPMEGCAYPVRRMTPAAVQPGRQALGIAADDIVIGAFVTPLKLSRRTTALWREILERIPRARLAFSPNADWLRDTYPDILAAAGIDAARAIMLPQGADEAANLARYALVDFVLDPMPFGNVNGTIEPLNMGVPVVTLVGQTHGERTGYSILSHVGETRTIATSGKEYVEIAVRLATDRAFAQDVRASLQRRMADPAVVDPRVYVRNLEHAYDAALAARGGGASGDGDGRAG